MKKLSGRQYSSLFNANRAIFNFKKRNPKEEEFIYCINQIDNDCYEIEGPYADSQSTRTELFMRQLLS